MNEWNDSLTGDYLWSNVNFGEAVTEVMTPLTWSVIQFTLDDWLYLPGIPTVGVIAGRPYLNISIFMTLFAGMGRTQPDLLRYMEATLYMRLPDELDIPTIPVSRWTLLRGFLLSGRNRWQQQRGVQQLPAYLAGNRLWFEQTRQALQALDSPAGLLHLWQAKMKRHIKQGRYCVLGIATHSADYTLRLRRQLESLGDEQDASVLIGNLSQGEAELESLGPMLGLERLARGEISREIYLGEYGHRGPDEFELSVPRPAENPAWLEQELANHRRAPVDIPAMLERQKQAYAAAWDRLQRISAPAARRFKARLVESARRATLREQARSAYVRDRWAVRLFALRAGDLTGLGERIFFLTLPEVLELLAGNPPPSGVIEGRLEAYQRYKALPPPPAIIRGAFDPFAWTADPHRPNDIFIARQPTNTPLSETLIVGAPGSAGVVEGIVRIIERSECGYMLQPGEILVATQTDIAWTLLFPRAAAVITDIGAPLSHAAIVARELGIPAVVGCGNATALLHTGDRVRVDGGRGSVEILEASSSRVKGMP